MTEDARRTIAARFGVAALNLLAPGLGLLRIARLKPAIAFLPAPAAISLALITAYALLPGLGFAGWAMLMLVLLAGIVAIFIGSIVLTWFGSRTKVAEMPWWSRWYGIVGAWILVSALGVALTDVAKSHFRTFYIPSEAMLPTLRVNDRLVASMRRTSDLRRGDMILFAVGDATYIKRVAALPGDRIAMQGGVVILNGQPVAQRVIGTERVTQSVFGNEARRLVEQFPGEATPHEIYDLGYSAGDNVEEQEVAPGHVFVLGDNRDMSADSRLSRAEFGVEQLPVTDIRGRALFYLWGPSDRMGEALNR